MHEIINAVIDTNHVMSAILSSRGASAKLIDWMTREDDYFHVLLSRPIWNEYQAVAGWLIPESRRLEKERILNTIRFQARWVAPTIQLRVCRDLSDNRFLECAVDGGAQYLVTKNLHHFPHKEYRGVKIVRISKFLEALERLAEQ